MLDLDTSLLVAAFTYEPATARVYGLLKRSHGEALHLAIASEQGATLCTLDKRLARAGKALGVDARLI